MDWSYLIFNLLVAAFAIPLLIAALRVWVKRLWTWSSRPRGAMRPAARSSAVDDLEEELASLRERMAAVEAIVTDDGYRLTRELERIDDRAPANRVTTTA